MRFERLRLAGFKTFVDPAEIVILPGLTGIVGPNGCGKSNLMEALRWVMGETSSKSLRGGGMEDVIFAGSTTRPERSHAEVMISIAGHEQGDQLEISRRITRDQGSTYRINGREVRARDVQILFADAASGARSPALVKQGQIGEIIAAKPQHRRRILEDAAGIAGLNARRHEAELRLKGAEDNLTRAEDILTQLERQAGDLKKQARQSERYKAIATQIRALELALLASGLAIAEASEEAARSGEAAATRAIAIAMAEQGATERARAEAAHGLEAARQKANTAQAALNRLVAQRAEIDAEAKAVGLRLEALENRRNDLARERKTAEDAEFDAADALRRLEAEDAALAAQSAEHKTALMGLEAMDDNLRHALIMAEQAVQRAQALYASAMAERRAGEHRRADCAARLARLTEEAARKSADITRLEQAETGLEALGALETRLEMLQSAIEAARLAGDGAEQALNAARAEEQALRPRLAEADRLAARLEAEARTIRALVEGAAPTLFIPVLNKISVEKGYETALAAALGDDLDAALEAAAPKFWGETPEQAPGPALPEGVKPLISMVSAPPSLAKRLAQIGIVEAPDGARLQALLHQGQRLVSLAGDLWRWDGFTRRAEAQSSAARRLAERNRLGEIESAAERARTAREAARKASEAAIRHLKSMEEAAQTCNDTLRKLQKNRDEALIQQSNVQKRTQDARFALEAARERAAALAADGAEAQAQLEAAEAALRALANPALQLPALVPLQAALAEARAAEQAHLAKKSALQTAHRHAEARQSAIRDEKTAWQARVQRSLNIITAHAARKAALDAEGAILEARPAELAAARRSIAADIEAQTLAVKTLGDALAEAETSARMAEQAARRAFEALSGARAEAARQGAVLEHARERLRHVIATLEATLDAPIAGFDAKAALAAVGGLSPDAIEARLFDLKHERDKLGAVNLRADIELDAIEGARASLAREREEIIEAIRRFRRAIDMLNSEGRARLRGAFERVNGHFSRLFKVLFGGGEAELLLVEADDPLEAGLDIIARPPGKKPQLLSLLSGGEQALTAISLIFAVFLSNPSPICVLDEVDAPLDDANVERLCDLLCQMAQETQTRFLVITHNPISMARMDRLYGVTMVERGVSQLVSVDLGAAEKLAEAV